MTKNLLDQLGDSKDLPSSAIPALHASLYGRARTTLAIWRGDPSLDIDLETIDPADRPHLALAADEKIRVPVPLNWATDVWGRGLAVLAEQFTLAVLEAGPGRAVLDTVSFDLQTRRQLEVQTVNVV